MLAEDHRHQAPIVIGGPPMPLQRHASHKTTKAAAKSWMSAQSFLILQPQYSTYLAMLAYHYTLEGMSTKDCNA